MALSQKDKAIKDKKLETLDALIAEKTALLARMKENHAADEQKLQDEIDEASLHKKAFDALK